MRIFRPRQKPLRSLSDEELAQEFDRRGPWVTRFRFRGREYGGTLELDPDVRVAFFFEAFPDVRTVLELGSLEGAHTFQLARRAAHVTAVEGRPYNIERARFVQELLGVENVRFLCADLEQVALPSFGRFDAVFCSGVLYHLPEPWKLVAALPAVAPRILVWTHYAAEAEIEVEGVPGRWCPEFGLEDPLSGLSAQSFWMTLPALLDQLQRAGYDAIDILRDEPDHPHGRSVTLAAARRADIG